MFIHYRTQGFILKKIDRGEADRLLTIYTKDFGKLEILAKAIRKISSKLRSGADFFYLSEIEFIQGKTHKTLTDAILIDSFKNLRKDLTRLTIAYKISEVLDRLVKGQESDKKLWQLLTEVFEKLNTHHPSANIYHLIYHYFLWNFLSLLGYQPELHYCLVCRRKPTPENIYPVRDNQIFREKQRKQISDGVYFNFKKGGLICNQCQKKTKSGKLITANTVKIIRILLRKDWSLLRKLKVEEEELNLLRIISNYYLSEVLKQTE